jgi:hypothetical protein
MVLDNNWLGRPSDVSLLFGSLPWQSFSPHLEPSREAAHAVEQDKTLAASIRNLLPIQTVNATRHHAVHEIVEPLMLERN